MLVCSFSPRSLCTAFDTNVVVIGKNDVQDFIGTLDYCLKKGTPAAASGKA